MGLEPTEDELATTVAHEGDDDVQLDPGPVEDGPDATEKTPDPAAEPTGEPKTVDLRALQEARASERELRQQNTVLMGRLNEVISAMSQTRQPQAAPQQEPSGPPPADDPFARLNWLVDQFQVQQTASAEQQQAMARQQAERSEHEQFVGRVRVAEEAFKKSTPDFDQAVEFARQARDAELALLYPMSTPDQRQQAIYQDWANVARSALQAGMDPAAQIYKFAQARGYTGAAAAPNAGQQQAIDPRAMAERQQRHMSLSDAPGGERAQPVDAKALANMTDKQFKAWMSQKGNEAKFDEIMGG